MEDKLLDILALWKHLKADITIPPPHPPLEFNSHSVGGPWVSQIYHFAFLCYCSLALFFYSVFLHVSPLASTNTPEHFVQTD